MTELRNRRNGRTGHRPALPAIECLGCGALHALVDRLTVAVEALEARLPAEPQPAHAPEPGRFQDRTNPDGIPNEPDHDQK